MRIAQLSTVVLTSVLSLAAVHAAERKLEIEAPEGYTLSTIEPPERIDLEVVGLSIDDQDRVFICTRAGEIVRRDPDGSWQILAEGMNEPAGLHVNADGSDILVAQKSELTRLEDRDGDGHYERHVAVTSGFGYSGNYHEYHFGPVLDSRGRLYGCLNLSHGGNNKIWVGEGKSSVMHRETTYRGWVYRSDRDGHFLPFASGVRSPAGITMSPNDELFVTDNQGDWVPTSALYHVREGQHMLHPASLIDHPWLGDRDPQSIPHEELVALQTDPALWIPHAEVGNSPGNPVWDTTEGRFGPFAGQIFTADQTQSRVFRMGLEWIDSAYQGWVINFVHGLRSGGIRMEFDSHGQLWVGQTGRGWKAKGGEQWALERIEYDGHSMPFAIHDMRLETDGFTITFTKELAADEWSPAVERWHYLRHSYYGSKKQDNAGVPCEVIIAADRMSARLVLPELKTGYVYAVTMPEEIKAADGSSMLNRKIYYTLNRILSGENSRARPENAQLPGAGWHMHDRARPRPIAVDPGLFKVTPMPSDAVVIDDWSNDSWKLGDGQWRVGDGSNKSEQPFGEGWYHLEFRIPEEVKGKDQGRGNSGFFLMGRYEVQILSSHSNQTYADGQCAALYGQEPPRVNACRPDGEWQRYDMLFRAPRFKDDGTIDQPARITLFHNGILVHEDMAYLGPTSYRKLREYQKHADLEPLKLQDHGAAVEYRNLWHHSVVYDSELPRFMRRMSEGEQ